MKQETKLHKTVQELTEAQRAVERTARGVVDSVRRMVAAHETLEPKAAIAFPRVDPRSYDEVEAALAAEGFRSLGDFQPVGTGEKDPEQRSYYRIALGDDGRIAATWFVVPTKPPREPSRCVVLQTWLADGRSFETAGCIIDSGLPTPPEATVTLMPAGTSVAELLRTHRSSVAGAAAAVRALSSAAELFATRLADEERTRAFREQQGMNLFEPNLRAMLGDRFEETGRPLLDLILAHPEWWTGEVRPPELMFLMSRDESSGRVHLTTAGMLAIGLPELQMKDVAANHCLAARLVMGHVAKALAADESLSRGDQWVEPSLSGRTLSLSADPKAPAALAAIPGRPAAGGDAGPVEVRLVLEGFGGRKRGLLSFLRSDPQLLHVLPAAATAGDRGQWLRDACRRLGYSAPDPRPLSALADEMQAVSGAGRARLPLVREQFLAGLPDGDAVLVKRGLPAGPGHEYVWVSVREWTRDGAIVGRLESQPLGVAGLTRGQEMRLAEDDVFDIAIQREGTGLIEPAFTDVVAQEFGVDLHD